MYQSAAGMMVNEYRTNVLANNIANAETPGFKRDIASFAERQRASEAGRREGASNDLLEGLTGGLWLGETETDFSEASFVRTEQPLDVAIAGAGFLRVRSNGNEYLTRDGRMLMTDQGWLVSAVDGAEMLGQGGQPIRLNPRGAKPHISENGTITQGNVIAGRLDVVNAENYQALRKVGASRFDASATRLTEPLGVLQSGYVEGPGVEAVKELTTMIEASRAYQLNAQMVTLQDQSAGRLINVVANV